MDSEIEDPTGEGQPDDRPAVDDDPTAPVEPAPVVDEPGDADELDWERVLAKVSRDTATTRTLVAILLVVVVVASVVLGVLIRTKDDTTQSASAASPSSTTSTQPAVPSVAGEPCVALADPLPAGAPPIDIPTGDPPTAVVTDDIKVGTGAEATATSTVSVNYVGVACSNGKIFDTSYKGGTATPVSLQLAQVIPGFAQGVTGMKAGGQRLIGIPSDQAYGSQGGGTTIAPDEALWFVVDLVSVT